MLPDDVPSVEPVFSVQGLDSEALRLERKIFLNSEIGQYLQRQLWDYAFGKGTIDSWTRSFGKRFDKIVIGREEISGSWVIRGRIGEKVYSVAITELEIASKKVV